MKKWIALNVLIFACLNLSAQEETKDYMADAGALSTLFRGKLPQQYPYQYNGTYFWNSPDFREGSIVFNGKLYPGIYLNIDAARQELQVRLSREMSPIVLREDLVSWFTIGNEKYVSLRSLGYDDAPAGYFLVVRDGSAPLLLQVNKTFTAKTGDHNGKEIGYDDPDYNPDLVNYFARSEQHYTLTPDGQVQKMRRSAWKKEVQKNLPSSPYLYDKAQAWKGTDAPEGIVTDAVKLNGIGLPEGYFSAAATEEKAAGTSTGITASYRNKMYVIGSGDGKGNKKVTGTVTELETGDPLPGAVIYDDNSATYARSDAHGNYSIQLPGGSNILNFSYEGKEEIALKVDIRGDGSLNIELPDKVELLKASVVSAQSMANHRTAEMGVETVSIRTMNKIPSAFGEGDILKAVLTLPGVTTAGEASGGFNVRGGAQDQNLILFDESTIYNPTHLFGIFSAFNPDITEDVQLYKSSIPARYGGRISSVLTVKTLFFGLCQDFFCRLLRCQLRNPSCVFALLSCPSVFYLFHILTWYFLPSQLNYLTQIPCNLQHDKGINGQCH